ncbi:MAG: hypothetical protein N2482_00970 [Patescibacteria group bacterium]|nr:hypothetical protein [Patescibacteria group bacterium]
MNYTIPISEMRKKFGEIEAILPYVDYITISKKGKPLAIISAVPEIKKSLIKKFAGVFKKTDLDKDKIWKNILKKRSRKNPIKL